MIVGAGLSGIGAGSQLEMKCPGRTYAVLEARNEIGGTWDLFRYPGIRSDSDMFTLGYAFRPWTDPKAIADGPSILRYVRDTAREHGVDEKVRFGHRVVRAEWSSADARWTLEIERGEERETTFLTCGFLFMCSGYYRYDEPYKPEFAGTERFRRDDRAPAAVERRHRLRREARGGDRQRRQRGHARARDGGDRRARDDAPALAQLRGLAAGRGPAGQPHPAPASDEARVLRGAVDEGVHHHGVLQSQPPAAERDQGHAAQGGGATAAGRVRRGHPLQAPLQPVGPAHVPRSRTAISSRR